ncbi:MAG: c-type cytochrome [Myxococcota bacterium]|nr:cytochrome c [Myxococcales bacterium]
MLTKSQARAFFAGGTIFFSAIFVLLTVDTLRKIPARQNSDRMTASVVRGKTIWEANNCMGCHTILGEGAYYAPELTRVVERRGEEWIRLFLRDPEAMYPGRRRMARYGFGEEEITDVIAFLGWIGEIDTNGFPPEPDLRPATALAARSDAPASARPAYFDRVCIACHSLGGQGGVVGPALDGVASRMDPATLDRWLANPQAVKPGTAMPDLRLPDDVRRELVAWLSGLE